jgi:hypothetical protein
MFGVDAVPVFRVPIRFSIFFAVRTSASSQRDFNLFRMLFFLFPIEDLKHFWQHSRLQRTTSAKITQCVDPTRDVGNGRISTKACRLHAAG